MNMFKITKSCIKSFGIKTLTTVVIPLTAVVLVVNFTPPAISGLILNPEKIMKIAQHKQKKAMEQSQKDAEKKIQKDLKDPNSNLLNNKLDPIIGNNTDPAVVIVEYLDYRCGYCKKAHFEMKKVLEDESLKNKVKVIIKNYPVIGGEVSLYAAQIATAVYSKHPEKFSELHDKLFINDISSVGDVDAVLKSLSIDPKSLEIEKFRDAIIKNFEFARDIQISGTPAFVIGDEFVGGYMPSEELKAKIQSKIKK